MGRMSKNANIIFGALIDDNLGDKVRITVLATGFDSADKVMNTRKAAEVKQQQKQQQDEQVKDRINDIPNSSIPRKVSKEKVSRAVTTSEADSFEEYGEFEGVNYQGNANTNTARKNKIRNRVWKKRKQ